MSSSMPPPPPSRSASCFVAKPARGFQLLRIDGYSCTKDLPSGERVTSKAFTVGGRRWCVDYYPNGADASADESGAIALYLRLVGSAASGGGIYDYYPQIKARVRASYKFSLLDLATGDAAYERPEETDVFKVAGSEAAAAGHDAGCGYAAFITRQELEGMIREDRLAIRCDVGVTEVAPLPPAVVADNTSPAARILGGLAPRHRYNTHDYMLGDELYYGGLDGWREGIGRNQEQLLDDKEYIRRCLAGERPRE
ncbi:unnamed protein product [Urochloa decumbens]|uniref:MATH domain-containing protein n=1 Tax=Urochloa decumbens TaxID=240449 RepID=A0ABC9BCU3_9POAL